MLLRYLDRIPEFTKLWRDIIHKPQSLTPQFNGKQNYYSCSVDLLIISLFSRKSTISSLHAII